MSFLLLCVPAQYLISKYLGNNDIQRAYAMDRFVGSLKHFKSNYLEWDSWMRWCLELPKELLRKFRINLKIVRKMPEECPAVDVRMYRGGKNGYFTESLEIRSPRPKHIKYKLGQVVKNIQTGYRGIIVGWDLEARAPQSWLHENHPKNKLHWRDLPHYLILVDTRDRPSPQKTYEVESNLILLTKTKVFHPDINDYFDGFDGTRYIPRDALNYLYPDD